MYHALTASLLIRKTRNERSSTEGVRQVACSSGSPLVPVVQPTNLPNGNDLSSVWRLNRPGLGAVFLQRQVCAAAMIIFREALEMLV